MPHRTRAVWSPPSLSGSRACKDAPTLVSSSPSELDLVFGLAPRHNHAEAAVIHEQDLPLIRTGLVQISLAIQLRYELLLAETAMVRYCRGNRIVSNNHGVV